MGLKGKILYLVHCIDTEGPLTETLAATFKRLEDIFGIRLDPTAQNLKLIQNMEMDLKGNEEAVAKCFSPDLLKYNSSWDQVDDMLEIMLSKKYRRQMLDDYGEGWVYSWHCMDHAGYRENPRHKDLGFGNVFNFYKTKLDQKNCRQDEINWHFHPLSFSRSPTQAATSYLNSYDVLLEILCRRIIDNDWFPVVNRPGFHSERPDSHSFLEQWIPFDFANQSGNFVNDQPDLSDGRFGDWRRAPQSWRGYHPSHDDYQLEGTCRRKIFRCLNVGTRLRSLSKNHVIEAFTETRKTGSAILSFANHDYRDMRNDVEQVREYVQQIRSEFPDVSIKHAGAEQAAIEIMEFDKKVRIELTAKLEGNVLLVEVVQGEIFGPQPFLAIKTNEGNYYHDNFDVVKPKKKWSYVFDEQTLNISSLKTIGVGTAGIHGKSFTCRLDF